jgi:hypothetical protein
VSKLRERQGLVDLEGFNLAHETSLEGLFGVSGSGREAHNETLISEGGLSA